MIVQVSGNVLNYRANNNYREVDVDTKSGLAYRVLLPSKDFQAEIGDQIKLFTSLQVREDSSVLYGFSSEENRDFFEKLISVSGIGPKIGLALLSMYTVSESTQFIISGDHKALSKTPGIGPKGAKKVILELGGILSTEIDDEAKEEGDQVIRELSDVLSSLGFKGEEKKKMILSGEEILIEEPDLTIEQLLQKVLRRG